MKMGIWTGDLTCSVSWLKHNDLFLSLGLNDVERILLQAWFNRDCKWSH